MVSRKLRTANQIQITNTEEYPATITLSNLQEFRHMTVPVVIYCIQHDTGVRNMHCKSLHTLYTYIRFRLGLIDLVENTVAKIAI